MRKNVGISLLFIICTMSLSLQSQGKGLVDLEDLLFYEKIILDFYSSEKLKSQAIQELDTRCRWKDTSNALSCANLAILYQNMGDLPRAYTASALAYKKEPRVSYYRNLFQNLAMQSGNIKDMQKRMGSEGKTLARYSRAIQECNDGFASQALPDVRILISEGHLRKQQFQNGIFADCFKNQPELLAELIAKSKPNPISYKNLVQEEEDRNNPFYSSWDLEYYRKERNNQLTENDTPKEKLTEHWVDCKSYIASGNISSAKQKLSEIRTILNQMKTESTKKKILAESMELAIRLSLAQDPNLRVKSGHLEF
jgi:hypothetical protein